MRVWQRRSAKRRITKQNFAMRVPRFIASRKKRAKHGWKIRLSRSRLRTTVRRKQCRRPTKSWLRKRRLQNKVLWTPAPRWRIASRKRFWPGGNREAGIVGDAAAIRCDCDSCAGKTGGASFQRRNDCLEMGKFRDPGNRRGLFTRETSAHVLQNSQRGYSKRHYRGAAAEAGGGEESRGDGCAVEHAGRRHRKIPYGSEARDGAGSCANPRRDGASDRKIAEAGRAGDRIERPSGWQGTARVRGETGA